MEWVVICWYSTWYSSWYSVQPELPGTVGPHHGVGEWHEVPGHTETVLHLGHLSVFIQPSVFYLI